MKRFFLIAALILCAASANAKLSLRSVFSDGMVLQQKTEAAIWGEADANAEISISTSWGARLKKIKADENGIWKAQIPTCEASYAPQTITVSCGKEEIKVNDVLIGEVWFASGQSNMEMPISGFFNCPVENAGEVIADAPGKDRVRMFTVKKTQSYEPLDDVVAGEWKGAESANIAGMSATAFFFARKMNEILDLPVGIVLSAYGGARVESWTPKDILETYPDEKLSREEIENTQEWIRPYLAYNAMLNPLRGYTVKGFIWYQGCSNVGKHEQFVERMSNMVARWRKEWNDENASLPFYQVEIAPCETYGGNENVSPGALLRQAQHEAAHKIPNSAIVVTNDLVSQYEYWNIHPCKKQPVGERLAYLALNRDYGYSGIPCYSPEAVSVKRTSDDGEIGVELTECQWNGLSRTKEIESLEVRGEDGVWHEVKEAEYSWSKKLLLIKSAEVSRPVEVRYGWGDFRPGNLKAWTGLPVSPFDLMVD
ncbi:MAG: sialate O-acetylesterase [Bacteroidales bacterium]|nr:sialate O-acetylesterase [Bacteroidales bacterium]